MIYTVKGLDALCREPEREAAEIYMGDTSERESSIDMFRVSVNGVLFSLVASVDWSATDET